jgi:hypothetical protein
MNEPSTCVGCIYAEWGRTTSGRLHPSGDGRCRYFKENTMHLRLPAAFFWPFLTPPVPYGGRINRRAKDGVDKGCAFKSEEAKP